MSVQPICERLRRYLQEAGAKPVPVIFELAVSRNGPGAYATLGDQYRTLATAIDAAAKEDGGDSMLVEPQAPAIAPYVFAVLRGERVEQLVRSFPAVVAHVTLNQAMTGEPATRSGFHPGDLVGEVISEPLASRVRKHPARTERIIIHLDVTRTSKAARAEAVKLLQRIRERDPDQTKFDETADATHPYVFATMSGYAILALVDLDRNPDPPFRAIYRIWEDAKVHAFIVDSLATVKADAAHVAFSAVGKDIVWAVLDSGIDVEHPHFKHFRNADLTQNAPLAHLDFRVSPPASALATVDPGGHGTHVAGIIAGAASKDWPDSHTPVAVLTSRNEAGAEEKQTRSYESISGMAPQCKLLSLRVLDDDGTGVVSSLISAIDQIQQWNDHGRHIVIHGVNLSLGYPFDAEWFACGQSPLCVEVDRLVNSGVVVVVAAGNSGYGYFATEYVASVSQGIGMSINDPGNAELAITVGATHRTEPHKYGVSYFSSKGPTGDGRLKPDLLGPGERIVSCASAQSRTDQTVVQSDGVAASAVAADAYTYREESGTSMAAPHVSGIIAAFLSIRREYIGRPRDVKAIFMSSATDLGRDRTFQGAGLVDLMRAIQSV